MKTIIKKGIICGIILLFLGASVVSIVLGNNNTGLSPISNESIQTNFYNKDDNSLILWGGEGTVTWPYVGRPIVNVSNHGNTVFTYNLSEPGIVYIIVLYNVTVNLGKKFTNAHGGRFTTEVFIDGELKDQIVIDRCRTDPGTEDRCNAAVVPVEILTTNTTLEIHMEIGAKSLQTISFGPLSFDIEGKLYHRPRTDNVTFQII